MFDLKNKTALVSGCGSSYPGFSNGKATALALARQGARVIGLDYSLEAARETKALIEDEGGRCDVLTCDVTQPDQVQQAVRQALELAGGAVDILVNNVGGPEPGDPVTMSVETWDAQFDLNVRGAFLMCKYVIPGMVERGGGTIINISSTAAIRYTGKPQVAYAASKAALVQMTQNTAVLYAPHKVRLNCVLPGLMWTPLVEGLVKKFKQASYDEFVEKRNRQVPMGMMGNAWDVAHAVVFLASDESRYVTGTKIIVDGGFTATTK